MTKEIQEQIMKCEQLLKELPQFETKPENGYGHIKVEYDENYEKPLLWVAYNVDTTMTLIDLQQLEKHLQQEKEKRGETLKYQQGFKLDLMKLDEKARQFFIELIQSTNITITQQTEEGWDEGFCVNVLCTECTAQSPVSFDNKRLNFKEGDKFTLITTIDEHEGYGATSIQQVLHYADGDWDIKDYEYIDFDKQQDI